MRPKHIILFALLITACRPPLKKKVVIDPSWIKLQLPHGWEIHAPIDFKMQEYQGIDSRVGIVYSKKDSVRLTFDCGRINNNNPCDVDANYNIAKANVDTGYYDHYFNSAITYQAEIDTIDGNIAVIVLPRTVGKGGMHISLKNCATEKWLGFGGDIISADKQLMVLNIFKTIKQTGAN